MVTRQQLYRCAKAPVHISILLSTKNNRYCVAHFFVYTIEQCRGKFMKILSNNASNVALGRTRKFTIEHMTE
jgi:hypothetical protein